MLDAEDLLTALRSRGVAALHVVKEGRRSHDADQFLVFLEGTRGEADVARSCLAAVPGVQRVEFACHTRSMLHVYARAQVPY